jgi:DNA-binding NtrC family response regulator
VISDIRMPEIDGFAVLQHARRRSPHMACMLLSGAYDTATLPDDLASTVEIVNKPCSGKVLKAAVDGLLAAKLA